MSHTMVWVTWRGRNAERPTSSVRSMYGILGADHRRIVRTITDELDAIGRRLQRCSTARQIGIEQGEALGLGMALPERLVGAAVRGLTGIDRAAARSFLLDVRELGPGIDPWDRAQGTQPVRRHDALVARWPQDGVLHHAHARFDAVHRLHGAGRAAEGARVGAGGAVVLGVHRRVEVAQIDPRATRDGIALALAGVRRALAVVDRGELEVRGDACLVRGSVEVGGRRAGIPEAVGHRVAQVHLIARAVLHREVGAPDASTSRRVADEFLPGGTGERERMPVSAHDVVGADDRPVVRAGAHGERTLAAGRTGVLTAQGHGQEVLATDRRDDRRCRGAILPGFELLTLRPRQELVRRPIVAVGDVGEGEGGTLRRPEVPERPHPGQESSSAVEAQPIEPVVGDDDVVAGVEVSVVRRRARQILVRGLGDGGVVGQLQPACPRSTAWHRRG